MPLNKKVAKTTVRAPSSSGKGSGSQSARGGSYDSDLGSTSGRSLRKVTDGVSIRQAIQEINAALKAVNNMTRVAKQNEKLMSTREISEIEDPLREARDELLRSQAMLANRQSKDVDDVIGLANDAIQLAKNSVANAQRLMSTAKQTSSRAKSQPNVEGDSNRGKSGASVKTGSKGKGSLGFYQYRKRG